MMIRTERIHTPRSRPSVLPTKKMKIRKRRRSRESAPAKAAAPTVPTGMTMTTTTLRANLPADADAAADAPLRILEMTKVAWKTEEAAAAAAAASVARKKSQSRSLKRTIHTMKSRHSALETTRESAVAAANADAKTLAAATMKRCSCRRAPARALLPRLLRNRWRLQPPRNPYHYNQR